MALSDRGFEPKDNIGGRGVKRKPGYGKSIFLDRMGFCEKWRNLIHGCLCNEDFGVLVDGVPHGYFPVK